MTALLAASTDPWRLGEWVDRLRIVRSDLGDPAQLAEALGAADPEICIHLAWRGWAGQAEPEENLTSVAGSLNLLKLLPQLGCRRLVTAGTCFEYALGSEPLEEEGPLDPLNIYALSKAAFHDIAWSFGELYDLEVVVARLFYSYGPAEDARRVVPAITRSLLNGDPARITPGEQVRDYLHVEDVASALRAVAFSSMRGAVNIASGEPVTIADLARTIGEVVGRPELIEVGAMPYREGDPMHIVADASRLRREIGWSPGFDLRSGIADTVDWWRRRTVPEAK